jgi:Photosynthesis system II assembly factor YCF48
VRRLRALVLIGISLAAVAVVSAVWELPQLAKAPATLTQAQITSPLATKPGELIDFGFLSAKLGWAAATDAPGNLFIFSTIDGAAHWKSVTEIPYAGFGVPQLHVLNARDMWITAQTRTGDTVLKSQDGGYSWTELVFPDALVSDVGFSDPKHGWAVARGLPSRLFMTDDGGLTWNRRPDLPLDFASAVFRNPDEGWLDAIASNYAVYRTEDGGQTWQPIQLPPPPTCPPKGASCQAGEVAGEVGTAGPVAAYFAATITLFPTGAVLVDATAQCTVSGCPNYGEMEFISFDAGARWNYVAAPPGGYGDNTYGDDHNWWSISNNTLVKTADAGRDWVMVSNKVEYDHLLPHILDAKHAWAMQNVVDDSHVRAREVTAYELDMTADGGLTWTTVSVPVPG